MRLRKLLMLLRTGIGWRRFGYTAQYVYVIPVIRRGGCAAAEFCPPP